MKNIYGITFEELENYFVEIGSKKFHGKFAGIKIQSGVFL